MTNTEKNQPQQGKNYSTCKKVITPSVAEESVTLMSSAPKVRYLKVEPFRNEGTVSPATQLRLKGCWLLQAGFDSSQYVSITVLDGMLIIRPATVK